MKMCDRILKKAARENPQNALLLESIGVSPEDKRGRPNRSRDRSSSKMIRQRAKEKG